MHALEENKNVLTWFGICPIDNRSPKLAKAFRFFVIAAFYFIHATVFLSSIVYFMKYVSNDLVGALYAFFQSIGNFNCLYSVTVGIILNKKIYEIFKIYERFYTKFENNKTYKYLVRANENGNWISGLYNKYAVTLIVSVLTFLVIYSISSSLLKEGQIDQEYFIYSIRLSLPWNQETLFGWFAVMIYAIIVGSFFYMVNGVFLLFFVGIGEHNRAFFYQFRDMLADLDSGSNVGSVGVKSILCDIIKFHISIRNTFTLTADIISLFLLIQIVTSMIFMSCCIFQLDMALHNLDENMLLMVSAVSISTMNLFFYCYYGGQSTGNFLEMSKLLFESQWIVLPVELQKFYILMIANAQQPLYYHGFHVVNLGLETFAKALKTVISYYMMFKTLTRN